MNNIAIVPDKSGARRHIRQFDAVIVTHDNSCTVYFYRHLNAEHTRQHTPWLPASDLESLGHTFLGLTADEPVESDLSTLRHIFANQEQDLPTTIPRA